MGICLYSCFEWVYDPETGRFISQDSIDFIVSNHLTGLNLYAYCNNNPVMYSDPSGNFVISASAIIIGAVIGATIGLATTAVADYREDQILFNGNNFDYLFNGLTGAITGAVGGVFANASFALQLGVSATMGAS